MLAFLDSILQVCQPTRAKASQWVGKVPKLIPTSLWNTPARKRGKALSRMASRQNGVEDEASHSRKQTARSPNVHWWFSHQGWDFTVKQDATIIHECRAAYMVSTFSLTMGVGASKHSCPPLGCLKRWQSDHTSHHHHRSIDLAAKSEKWNGKPRLAYEAQTGIWSPDAPRTSGGRNFFCRVNFLCWLLFR